VAGSTAVAKSDAAFAGWATRVVSYIPGTHVEDVWKDTSLCLGEPGEDVYHITCLGRAGTITLAFDRPIADGEGWDFAVFENAFGNGFLELAYVEVSSDGVNFVRFPCHSETASAVGAYASNMDPTKIDGLASKYKLGYGTPFDIAALAGVAGSEHLDPDWGVQVRLVDIVGDGSCRDSDGRIIYDPYPTTGSAGFDLDAIGVRHFAQAEAPELSVEVVSGAVRLGWQGRLGLRYQLYESNDLASWQAVGEAIDGADGAMSLDQPLPSQATFYVLRAL